MNRKERQANKRMMRRMVRGLTATAAALNKLARASEKAANSLLLLGWIWPGRWPDYFVLLKRSWRTGIEDLAERPSTQQ